MALTLIAAQGFVLEIITSFLLSRFGLGLTEKPNLFSDF